MTEVIMPRKGSYQAKVLEALTTYRKRWSIEDIQNYMFDRRITYGWWKNDRVSGCISALVAKGHLIEKQNEHTAAVTFKYLSIAEEGTPTNIVHRKKKLHFDQALVGSQTKRETNLFGEVILPDEDETPAFYKQAKAETIDITATTEAIKDIVDVPVKPNTDLDLEARCEALINGFGKITTDQLAWHLGITEEKAHNIVLEIMAKNPAKFKLITILTAEVA